MIGSYTLDYEISQNPFESRRKSITQFIEQCMTGYVGIERSESLTAIANGLMKTGVKEKDQYHVAAAIFASCDYFITTDYRLLRHQNERIKLVSPIEFVIQMEGEK